MIAFGTLNRRNRLAFATLAALSLGSAFSISGCGTQEQYWTPSAAPKENHVDWITLKHRISFDPSSAALSNGERGRFEKFLNEIDVGFADQVAIAVVGTSGQSAQLADRRVASVRSYLQSRTIDPIVSPGSQQGAWDGSVTVIVGRYVVTPPACPNWEKPPGYDFNNTESSNLGCSTTTNLGLMVADPGDLVRTRRVGPADGTVQAKSIENFREGKSAKAGASVLGAASGDASKGKAGSEARTDGGE